MRDYDRPNIIAFGSQVTPRTGDVTGEGALCRAGTREPLVPPRSYDARKYLAFKALRIAVAPLANVEPARLPDKTPGRRIGRLGVLLSDIEAFHRTAGE
jgi:hypothetical protein